MFGICLALLNDLLCASLIEVRANDSLDTGLRKRESSLFADAGRGLLRDCKRDIALEWRNCSLTPATNAMPPSRDNLDAMPKMNRLLFG